MMQTQVQTPKEVTEAIRDTFVALHTIEQNKLDEAKKALKAADEKFAAVLKKHPEFDLLPLEETLTAYTYTGSSKDIEAALKVSIELIKAHDTQVARALMMTLKNDTHHETHRMQKRADGLHDSVALEAENPKAIKGHSKAQERVEEATIKMEAQARKKEDLFNKEVAQDMKDTVK